MDLLAGAHSVAVAALRTEGVRQVTAEDSGCGPTDATTSVIGDVGDPVRMTPPTVVD
ncbi:hypothetical protein [Micromonospora sp. NPDC023888]|uniref:hypothetical protein n=1 Tax=Micromonospora sp. NPDC023888 TaxID=3155607 RepID=UPI0033D51E39